MLCCCRVYLLSTATDLPPSFIPKKIDNFVLVVVPIGVRLIICHYILAITIFVLFLIISYQGNKQVELVYLFLFYTEVKEDKDLFRQETMIAKFKNLKQISEKFIYN